MAKKSVSFRKTADNIKNLSLGRKKVSKQTGLLIIAITFAVALFGVSGWLWWTRSFANADRVFTDMLANNLSSSSVTRNVVEKNQSSSFDQTVFVTFQAPEIVSESRTRISEKGANRKTTTVTTEAIGTKNEDLVRYVSAEGAEDLSVAGNLDEILGVWGKRTPDPQRGESATFLNEAVFSIVPFGNLPPEKRSVLLDLIKEKKVYEYTSAVKSFENGRYVYNYRVSIKPAAFIEVLAKYVELTGIGDNSQLDPASYENAPPVSLGMKVDILSRQLRSIEYLSTGRTETIQSRNLYRDITLPEQTIPFEQLQQRLSGSPTS